MGYGNGFIEKHSKEFIVGTVLGGFFSGNFFFLNGGSWTHLVGEWVMRAIGTGVIAIVSGFATAYSKDLYKNFQDCRKRKNQEYDRRKKQSESESGTGDSNDQRVA